MSSRTTKRRRLVTSNQHQSGSGDESNGATLEQQRVTGFNADGTFVTVDKDGNAYNKEKPLPVIPLIDSWAQILARSGKELPVEVAVSSPELEVHSSDGKTKTNSSDDIIETKPAESLEDAATAALMREARGDEQNSDDEESNNKQNTLIIKLKDVAPGSKTETKPKNDSPPAAVGVADAKHEPMLIRNMVPGLRDINDPKQRFQHDMNLRPDALEANEEAYRIPIEDFGAAMLRGMQWDPKKGVGVGNNCRVVKPISMEMRPAGLGLGAIAKPRELGKNKGKGSGKHAARDARKWLGVGSLVRVLQGPHENEFAVVVQLQGVPGLDNVLVQVSAGVDDSSKEGGAAQRLPEVAVGRRAVQLVDPLTLPANHAAHALVKTSERQRRKDLEQAERDSKRRADASEAAEDEAFAETAKWNAEREKNKNKRSKKGRSRSPSRGDDKNKQQSRKSRDNKNRSSDQNSDTYDAKQNEKDRERRRKRAEEKCWLAPGIRVRVISKNVGDGKFFTQKGVVQVVMDAERGSCMVLMDSHGSVLEGVLQRQLESALPKPGGRVMVLRGDHKGQVGKLLQRSSREDKATVQLNSDLSIVTYRFAKVAEYCFEDEDGEDE